MNIRVNIIIHHPTGEIDVVESDALPVEVDAAHATRALNVVNNRALQRATAAVNARVGERGEQ